MGNEGQIAASGLHADSTLWSPADADSIISVGAADSNGVLASWSSCGPTADGRIKPEVVAQGMAVYWADGSTTTGYSFVDGTSCSTPLVAGAAALILSAHPKLTNMQVRQALLQTARHINDGTIQTTVYPNNYYGHGFVDAFAAVMHDVTPIANKLYQNFPNPFNKANPTKLTFQVPVPTDVELAVFNLLGQRVKTIYRGQVFSSDTKQWDGTDDRGRQVAAGVYFARLKTQDKMFSIKMLYLK
jgi:subtilisin family serine protease